MAAQNPFLDIHRRAECELTGMAQTRAYHDRMPAILERSEIDTWLSEPHFELIRPFGGELTIYPISREINTWKAQGSHLAEPIEP